MLLFTVVNFSAVKGRGQGNLKSEGLRLEVWILTAGSVRNVLCHGRALWEQRLVSWGSLVRNALCHDGGGPVAQRVVSRWRVCAQRVMSWAGLVCNALCRGGESVHNALCHARGRVCAQRVLCVTEGRACAQGLFWGEPFVTEGRPVHNALCHRGGGRCTTPCVTEGAPGGFLHSALCHRAGAALPTTPCVTRGALCITPCVTARPGSQRLVSPGGACAQRLVSQRGRGVCLWLSGSSNELLPCQSWAQIPGEALCTTPCVTAGGAAHNALCHRGCLRATPCVIGGGPCAQRLMSPRGDLCTTRCVAQRLVSPRGGLT